MFNIADCYLIFDVPSPQQERVVCQKQMFSKTCIHQFKCGLFILIFSEKQFCKFAKIVTVFSVEYLGFHKFYILQFSYYDLVISL